MFFWRGSQWDGYCPETDRRMDICNIGWVWSRFWKIAGVLFAIICMLCFFFSLMMMTVGGIRRGDVSKLSLLLEANCKGVCELISGSLNSACFKIHSYSPSLLTSTWELRVNFNRHETWYESRLTHFWPYSWVKIAFDGTILWTLLLIRSCNASCCQRQGMNLLINRAWRC